MNEIRCRQVLKAAGYENATIPLHLLLQQVVSDLETSRQLRELIDGDMTEARDRLRQLELEVTRLSAPPGTSFSWINGKPVASVCVNFPQPDPQAEASAPAEDERPRVSRQRRELRRLNQSQRMMKLELDHANRLNEDLSAMLLQLRKAYRVEESLREP